MTHYEVLGVAPDATDDEIRSAFKDLARRHHPDRTAGAPPADRVRSEELIRSVNDAWAVLSVPVRRASYDAAIGAAGVTSRSFVRKVSHEGFVPHDPSDDDDDDEWRYTDDVGDPRTAPGRLTVLTPVALLMVAALVGAFGLASGHDLLVVFAVVVGALGALGLVVVPMIAMGRASRYEGSATPRGGVGDGR